MIHPWISKSAIYMLSPELNYLQVKFGVKLSINFEVTGQNVILYGWSIWNGNGNGSPWLVLHFQVLVDSIDLTWHHVAESSHLTANVMTDRQTHTQTHTHRHTHRQTEWWGEKHNTFFQRYKKTLSYVSCLRSFIIARLKYVFTRHKRCYKIMSWVYRWRRNQILCWFHLFISICS